MYLYTFDLSQKNSFYISLCIPVCSWFYLFLFGGRSKSHKHHLFLDLHRPVPFHRIFHYSLELDNGLSLILVHSQLSNCVFSFFVPHKGVLAKAIAMNSHPRKLLATDLPHRVEELQHVLHGVASAAPRRLKFSMELKGAPGMLKGNRGEVVCTFF